MRREQCTTSSSEGYERKAIFHDTKDRDRFVERLGKILSETETPYYSWALMNNRHPPGCGFLSGLSRVQSDAASPYQARRCPRGTDPTSAPRLPMGHAHRTHASTGSFHWPVPTAAPRCGSSPSSPKRHPSVTFSNLLANPMNHRPCIRLEARPTGPTRTRRSVWMKTSTKTITSTTDQRVSG